MSATPLDAAEFTPRATETPVLEVDHVSQRFGVQRATGRGVRKGWVSALDDVSFTIGPGETFALVGETGSGKSTLARAVLHEPRPNEGTILVNGRNLTRLRGGEALEWRRQVQMVFQDPFAALNPRWRVERIVSEPLRVHKVGDKKTRHEMVGRMLDLVGLDINRHGARFPRELSGGQCQRVAIARALVLTPSIVICDEPVTALDVSIQAQILNLLAELRDRLQLTYLLIAHDLMVVQTLSQRVATLYLGKICEIGPTATIFERAAHPYTAALLSAIPPRPGVEVPVARLRLIGEPPSPLDPPSGCRFRTRCVLAQEICAEQVPARQEVGPGHHVHCHFPYKIHDYLAGREAASVGLAAPSPFAAAPAEERADGSLPDS